MEKGRKKHASVKESVDNENHDGYRSTMGVENHLHGFSAAPPPMALCSSLLSQRVKPTAFLLMKTLNRELRNKRHAVVSSIPKH